MKTAWLHQFVNDLDADEFWELSEIVKEREVLDGEVDAERVLKIVLATKLTHFELVCLKDSKLGAIKMARERTGLSLLDAKRVVDAHHRKLYPPCPRCGSIEEVCPC